MQNVLTENNSSKHLWMFFFSLKFRKISKNSQIRKKITTVGFSGEFLWEIVDVIPYFLKRRKNNLGLSKFSITQHTIV